ncbi:MAG: hypothetical protein ACRCVJ_11920 [Clostridium sp.]|uniref:hypothetical protein n=1 Tax=Clostridium sp. TaxID=1506 RepID=UPI003F2C888D
MILKNENAYETKCIIEQRYLSSNGINYNDTKSEKGVLIYKYDKNIELFKVLAKFYRDLEEYCEIVYRL